MSNYFIPNFIRIIFTSSLLYLSFFSNAQDVVSNTYARGQAFSDGDRLVTRFYLPEIPKSVPNNLMYWNEEWDFAVIETPLSETPTTIQVKYRIYDDQIEINLGDEKKELLNKNIVSQIKMGNRLFMPIFNKNKNDTRLVEILASDGEFYFGRSYSLKWNHQESNPLLAETRNVASLSVDYFLIKNREIVKTIHFKNRKLKSRYPQNKEEVKLLLSENIEDIKNPLNHQKVKAFAKTIIQDLQ